MNYINRLRYSYGFGKNRKYVRKRKLFKIRRFCPFFSIALLVFFIFACLSEAGLSSVSNSFSKEVAKKHLSNSVNTVISSVMKSGNTELSFVDLTKDTNGQILSISANTTLLNNFKIELTEKLNKTLNKRVGVYVPIGSLTDIALLNGRGFKVPIKMNFEGSVDISFSSEFVSAGINQSCHRITMTVCAVVISQSKRFNVYEDFETTTVISENIIIGDVPNLIAGTIT